MAKQTTATAASADGETKPKIVKFYVLANNVTFGTLFLEKSKEGQSPYELDLDKLPEGCDQAAIEYCINTGAIETQAMRDARPR